MDNLNIAYRHKTKGTRTVQWRKDSVFDKWSRNKWTSICKKIKIQNRYIPRCKTENYEVSRRKHSRQSTSLNIIPCSSSYYYYYFGTA